MLYYRLIAVSLEGTLEIEDGWWAEGRKVVWEGGLWKVTCPFLRSSACCVIRQVLYIRDGHIALLCSMNTSSYHILRSNTCWVQYRENSAPPVTILYLCWRLWIWKTQIWIFMQYQDKNSRGGFDTRAVKKAVICDGKQNWAKFLPDKTIPNEVSRREFTTNCFNRQVQFKFHCSLQGSIKHGCLLMICYMSKFAYLYYVLKF